MNSQTLSDKTVLVTGASSGIGRATARALAKQGMRVILTARSASALENLAEEIGEQTVVLPADLTDPEAVDRVIEDSISVSGRLDVLFANAGVYIAGDVASGEPDDWDRLLQLNVNSVFRAINRVLPHMIGSGSGDILVTGSISGHQAIHVEPVYSASKHAIAAFVGGLRRQLVSTGIRVGEIAPGTVVNELWNISDPQEIARLVAEGTGLRSEDVAEIAVFMLTRPRHVAIRDVIVFPQALDI